MAAPSSDSVSLPSPRQLAGVRAGAEAARSPTLEIRMQRAPAGSSPLFFASGDGSPPASPLAPRVRRRFTAEERAARQAERVRALAERQRWREANRVRQRRADTMQDLVMYMDGALVAGGPLEPVLGMLRDKMEEDRATLHVVPTSLTVLPSMIPRIWFERKVRSEYDAVQNLWAPLDEERRLRESALLHVLPASKLVDVLATDPHLACVAEAAHPAVDPDVWIDAPPRSILVVVGLEAYVRQQRTAQNRAYAESVRQRMQSGGSAPLRASGDEALHADLERALLRLQMRKTCHVIRIPTATDAVDWLHSIACDVSVRPYKLLETARAAPTKPSRTITGTSNLATYQAMLEQIPRCTPPAIYAITHVYPTYRTLMDALLRSTPEDATARLAALDVHNGRTTRRLGPQLARRIYDVCTSLDPLTPMEG